MAKKKWGRNTWQKKITELKDALATEVFNALTKPNMKRKIIERLMKKKSAISRSWPAGKQKLKAIQMIDETIKYIKKMLGKRKK